MAGYLRILARSASGTPRGSWVANSISNLTPTAAIHACSFSLEDSNEAGSGTGGSSQGSNAGDNPSEEEGRNDSDAEAMWNALKHGRRYGEGRIKGGLARQANGDRHPRLFAPGSCVYRGTVCHDTGIPINEQADRQLLSQAGPAREDYLRQKVNVYSIYHFPEFHMSRHTLAASRVVQALLSPSLSPLRSGRACVRIRCDFASSALPAIVAPWSAQAMGSWPNFHDVDKKNAKILKQNHLIQRILEPSRRPIPSPIAHRPFRTISRPSRPYAHPSYSICIPRSLRYVIGILPSASLSSRSPADDSVPVPCVAALDSTSSSACLSQSPLLPISRRVNRLPSYSPESAPKRQALRPRSRDPGSP